MSYYSNDPTDLFRPNMTRSNLNNLIFDARANKYGAQCSQFRWRAIPTDDSIEVWHWYTHMVTILKDNTTVRFSEGWDSPTDKSGISRIKSGLFRATDYDPNVWAPEIGA